MKDIKDILDKLVNNKIVIIFICIILIILICIYLTFSKANKRVDKTLTQNITKIDTQEDYTITTRQDDTNNNSEKEDRFNIFQETLGDVSFSDTKILKNIEVKLENKKIYLDGNELLDNVKKFDCCLKNEKFEICCLMLDGTVSKILIPISDDVLNGEDATRFRTYDDDRYNIADLVVEKAEDLVLDNIEIVSNLNDLKYIVNLEKVLNRQKNLDVFRFTDVDGKVYVDEEI